MGVPGFYRTIFRRYINDNIYKFVSSNPKIDYFYIDFNPIIYISLARLKSSNSFKGLNHDEIEFKIIEQTVEMAAHIINELVKPTKMVYIAIDGPAPKCKIVTQRARRYKGVVEKQIMHKIQEKYLGKSCPDEWDKASITPGTKFMAKLDTALYDAIAQGKLKCPQIIFNNSSVASEGEHKIVQHLSKLSHDPHESVCVYSNDGDMAFLTLQFPEKNMLTMIDSNFLPKSIKKKCKCDYVYFNNNKFHKVLINDMFDPKEDRQRREDAKASKDTTKDNLKLEETEESTETAVEPVQEPAKPSPKKKRKYQRRELPPLDPNDYDTNRILIDFMFLLFLGGNDFVRPIPFAKIRTNGVYKMFLKVYMFTLRKTKCTTKYLVNQNGTINERFFSNVMYGLSLQEPRRMLYYSKNLQQIVKREPEWGPFETWEEEWLEYQHTPYNSPSHPEHELVRNALLKFKYSEIDKHEEWKGQYYKANFGLNPNDKRTYNTERTKICREYIKSLQFTIGYYLTGSPPSWRWNYPYEVSPWPSDLVFALRHTNLHRLNNFNKSYPYTSQEQLLLTVPISSKVFPDEYRILHKLLPSITRTLDRVNGEKYIYAEPVLSEFDENGLLYEARKIKLQPDTHQRNQRVTKTLVFNRK